MTTRFIGTTPSFASETAAAFDAHFDAEGREEFDATCPEPVRGTTTRREINLAQYMCKDLLIIRQEHELEDATEALAIALAHGTFQSAYHTLLLHRLMRLTGLDMAAAEAMVADMRGGGK